MPAVLENLIKQTQEFWKSLDKTKKIIIGGIIAVLFFAFASMAAFSAKAPRTLLYSDLNQEEYGKITKALEAMGYNWKGSGTSSLYVDSDKRQAVITRLAQDNLIPVGIEGYEIFDISRWDETTFDKNIKLHRAIKGSLEKMLATLNFVKRAKVELAIPRKNNFLTDTDPVKASVVIMTVPGIEKVTRRQVMGIKNLIYRAVPKLKRKNITITNSEGHEFVEPDELDKAQRELELVERKKRFEEGERKRWMKEIKEKLHEFYPQDRISIIRVSLNVKWDEVTEKQSIVSPVESVPENPDTPYPDRKLMPNGTLIISQNKRNERFRGNGFTPGGPTGTEKQLPPGYRDLDYQRSEYGNDDTITNYAFNSTERNVKRQPWEEGARSIAVAVDGVWEKVGSEEIEDGNWKYKYKYTPPSEEELLSLGELLKASLLYDKIRGDQIEVRHLQKDRNEEFEAKNAELTDRYALRRLLVVAGISLLTFLLVYLLYRASKKEIMRRRRLREEELTSQQQLMREAALRVSEEETAEVELSVDERARREMLENAVSIAREKPEEVAKLLRTWLSEE